MITIKDDKDYVKLIQNDLININNTFDMINIKYKNNEDKEKIIKLNENIYKSLDNISSYSNDYKDKIIIEKQQLDVGDIHIIFNEIK